MTAQTDLFARTERRKRAGHASALDGIGSANAACLANIVKALVRGGMTCTSDEVYLRLPDGVKQCLELHPNAIPATMTNLHLAGLIEKTGEYVRSSRPEARGRRIAKWRAV